MADDIAVKLLVDLKRDFGLTDEQAAGVVGNLMYESGGFQSLQELSPTVPGSRGGFGYAQWTGPRRKSFESFTEREGLEPTSYEANYGFLKHELANDPYERRQFNTVKKAQTAEEAARLVSQNFLRPGKPNLSARQNLASKALGYASDMPAVGTELSVRQSPIPMQQSPLLASSRAATSPSGGDTGLQTALDAYARREGNRVTPAQRSPFFGDPGTPAQGPVVATIPSSPDAPLMASSQFSDDPGTPARGQVVSRVPSRSISDMVRGGDPGTPASGPVVATIPSRPQSYAGQERMPALARTAVGGAPTTRTVQSVPVSTRSSTDNVRDQRSEQLAQRIAAVPRKIELPNQAQLKAATGFSVPQGAQFKYNPTAPQPERLVADAYPKAPIEVPVAVASAAPMAVQPRVAPIPMQRPALQQSSALAPLMAAILQAQPQMAVRAPLMAYQGRNTGGGASLSIQPQYRGTSTGMSFSPGQQFSTANGTVTAQSDGSFVNDRSGSVSRGSSNRREFVETPDGMQWR